MANAFSKEERVAFEDILQGFQDALVLSRNVYVYKTDAQSMERSNNTIWRPSPYIAQSFDGTNQTGNFADSTQLSVPASININKSVPWVMTANDLNDALQENRLGDAAKQKLASDINLSVMTAAANQGTLVVKRTTAASGFDDVAQCEAIMNEQGVEFFDRYLALSTRDYNGMANNLADRTLDNSKSLTAYEEAYIGRLASFDSYKLDYANSLAAATATGVVVNGASQYYTPVATQVTISGTNNIDNRYQDIALTVGAGTVAVGDAFTLAGVDAVHHITKNTTGELKTFRVVDLLASGGATGTMRISPPIISAEGATAAEKQYQNVTATPANLAIVTFLNTVTASVNPFWRKNAIEIYPGRYAVPANAGAEVLRGSTDQGFELVMQKQYDINTMNVKYRLDTFYGVGVVQPEMCGIIEFNQI